MHLLVGAVTRRLRGWGGHQDTQRDCPGVVVGSLERLAGFPTPPCARDLNLTRAREASRVV